MDHEELNYPMDQMRRQVISQFAGISIDMDYMLCVPAVHAKFREEEIIIDYSGRISRKSDAFPQDKEEMLKKWVKLHEKEILENHIRLNHHESPVMIEPLNP